MTPCDFILNHPHTDLFVLFIFPFFYSNSYSLPLCVCCCFLPLRHFAFSIARVLRGTKYRRYPSRGREKSPIVSCFNVSQQPLHTINNPSLFISNENNEGIFHFETLPLSQASIRIGSTLTPTNMPPKFTQLEHQADHESKTTTTTHQNTFAAPFITTTFIIVIKPYSELRGLFISRTRYYLIFSLLLCFRV